MLYCIMLNAVFQSAISLVFPPVCELCENADAGFPLKNVCGACRVKIEFIPEPHCSGCGRTLGQAGLRCVHCSGDYFNYDRLYAACAYSGVMKELLHRYKFNGRKALKDFFSHLLFEATQRCLPMENFEAVIAVPADPAHLKERGFNQALLIARPLAKKLGLPHLSDCLKRHPSRSSQWRLGKNERKTNVENQFYVLDIAAIRDKKIVLIDDIVTTGHTVSECARVLKIAGARHVTVLALARGI